MSQHSFRWSIVYAATWRLITELVRRHDKALDLMVVQLHPGLSGSGLFQLIRAAEWSQQDGTGKVDFTLGGGARGTFHIHQRFDGAPTPSSQGSWPDGFSYVPDFLGGGDPRDLVDRIEAMAGLAPPSDLPASTPKTLAFRATAEFLERHCLGRDAYCITQAYADSSSGSGLHEWGRRPTWVQRETAGATTLGDWPVLGRAGSAILGLFPEAEWAEDLPERSLVVDTREGMVWRDGRYEQRVDLMAAYKSAGRRLGQVVNAMDELLK